MKNQNHAFTLIELSIVLVIIGLIVGGVLVGKDLTEAAKIRSQISQIERYGTAVNTFRLKYNCLPGDCKNAAQFGFATRGSGAYQGDGNGVISNEICPSCQGGGETGLFWNDLSDAKLISESFNTSTSGYFLGTTTNIGLYLPTAVIGNGNYIYAYERCDAYNDYSGCTATGINYFGINKISQFNNGGPITTSNGITPNQAFVIDSKIDDGLPQSGKVQAFTIFGQFNPWIRWANANNDAVPFTTATPATSTTCFDNQNTAGATQNYSNRATGTNCSVSLQFQ